MRPEWHQAGVSEARVTGMVVRMTKGKRIAVLVLAFVLAPLLSWSGIRVALAEHYAGLGTLSGYERAARLEPANPKYWYLLGRYWHLNMEQPDTKRAIELYRVALSLDPRATDTWLDLADAYEDEGDSGASRAAYLQAKRVYPASAQVAWRYGNFLLRHHELAAGLDEIGHAVAGDPALGFAAFRVCQAYGQDTDIILDRVLPPIPSVYSGIAWQLTDKGDVVNALKAWARLVALHPQLQKREVLFFVSGLLQSQQAREAPKVWEQALALADLPVTGDPPGSLIWDGGFETGVSDAGSAWRIEHSPEVMVSFDSVMRHSGKQSLRIDIPPGDTTATAKACHWVVPEPNTTYGFSAWVRSKDMADGDRISFLLVRPTSQVNLVSTSPIVPGEEWTRVSASWSSADDVQPLKLCVLEKRDVDSSPARATAWIDDVSLVKRSTP